MNLKEKCKFLEGLIVDGPYHENLDKEQVCTFCQNKRQNGHGTNCIWPRFVVAIREVDPV
jgi:hypothetical protein